MKIIDEISQMIDEELGDAKKYNERALAVHSEYPSIAEVFSKLSAEEMEHAKCLHDAVAALIDKQKREKDVPAAPKIQ